MTIPGAATGLTRIGDECHVARTDLEMTDGEDDHRHDDSQEDRWRCWPPSRRLSRGSVTRTTIVPGYPKMLSGDPRLATAWFDTSPECSLEFFGCVSHP